MLGNKIEEDLGKITGPRKFEKPIKQDGRNPKGYMLKELIRRKLPQSLFNKKLKRAVTHGENAKTFGAYAKLK